jgi:hypothetical protein
MSLHNYLAQFRRAIEKLENYGYAESLEINEEIRTNKLAVITVNVILVEGSHLHIKEYIDARYKLERIGYAYHYQDSEGKCVFRYDDAVHRPSLGFKEHKHTKDGNIIESPLPSILDLVDEVIRYL